LLDLKTGQGYARQVRNSPEGFARLGRWLTSHEAGKSETVLCSEHCGRYGEHLLGWTTANGWPHAVLKTTALEKVGGEHHRKSDPWDAQGLAEYGRRFADRLRLAEAPKPAVKQLKRLCAERRKMVDRRASLRQKRTEADYHDADMSRLLAMWNEQIALLSEHINEIEAQIATLISEDPALRRRHQTMRTAPGIGPVVGGRWMSLFAGQQTLDPGKICSRFGWAPHPHSSGSSVSKPNRSSGFGNGEMRRIMHQAALSVAQNYEHYANYYKRKKAEGKHHLVVINNIINKLIHLYCAMWNNRSEYDPNYIQKMKKQWKKSA
jgi:transposase